MRRYSLGLVLFTAALFLVMLILALLGLSRASSVTRGDCLFAPFQEAAVYAVPQVDAAQFLGTIPAGRAQLVRRQQGSFLYLETLDDDLSGWVARGAGSLTGDCANLSE